MFKNLIDKGKCSLGFHQGLWQYDQPNACLQIQICERCGTVSQRTEHQWGEWAYGAEDACELVHACARCQERESQVVHEWGDWAYATAGECSQVQICARCGEQSEHSQVNHNWNAWVYDERYHAPVRSCARCGDRMSSFPRQVLADVEAGSVSFAQGKEDLIAQRQAIMEALWAVEDSAPNLEGPAVQEAASAAVGQLQALLPDWEAEDDALERGRTWRFLGDAYFSLSGKTEQEALELGRQAYLQAEALLEVAGNLLEQAKCHFNLANTLRLIRQGDFFPYLEQAKAYYLAALELFQVELPEAVPQVESSLQSLEPMIQAQAFMLASAIRMEELRASLEKAGDQPDPALLQAIQQEADQLIAEKAALQEQASALTGREPEPSIPTTEEGKERLLAAMEAGADTSALFGILQEQYQAEIAAGRISPERQQLLDSVMAEGQKLTQGKAEALPDMMARSAKARELLDRVTDAVAKPDAMVELRNLPAGSRAAALAEMNERLFKYVVSESTRPYSGEQEWEAIGDFMARFIGSRNAISKVTSDVEAHKLEQESLRRLAMDTRAFSLRHHLTLAKPIWPSPVVSQNPNAIFYSGGAEVQKLLAQVCQEQALALLPTKTQGDPAQFRWNQLRLCHAAVFDLTTYRRPMPAGEAAALASVAYELGIALASGRPVVVVAKEGQELPFDVDVEPVRLAQNEQDDQRLVEALDAAIYSLQRGGADSSVDESLRFARQAYAGHGLAYVRIALEQLDDSTEADPLKVRDILSTALGYMGPEAPSILYPTWPGDYPELHADRCFHVTAFGPEWAGETMRLVREACQRAKREIAYIRGDQVLSPDIIRSIWDEICRASHVVVDLTGLNVNAVLELGMAQALGRNVLLITQETKPEMTFRSVAKIRMHHYSLDDPAGLNQVLDAFLSQA